jgi:hypothetical protein
MPFYNIKTCGALSSTRRAVTISPQFSPTGVVGFPDISSFQTEFSIRPRWSSLVVEKHIQYDKFVTNSILGDNIFFFGGGVPYQIIESL